MSEPEAGGSGGPGRLLLRNARLSRTAAPASVTIVDGVVQAIGPEAPDDAAQVTDLEGRFLLPGLRDAHVHFALWASRRQSVDLTGARTAAEAVERVAVATDAADAAADEVVRGFGFRDAAWPDRPHKRLLEARLPGRAIALVSNDQHQAWLSDTALALVGADDHPTGLLRESACFAALRALPQPSIATVDRWVVDAASEAAARGVTGIRDFEFADNVADWRRRANGHVLDVRVDAVVMRDDLDAAIDAGVRTGDPVGDSGLVTVGPVKIFVDGSLNSRTALCFDPYPAVDGESVTCGVLETPPGELQELVQRAAAHGLDVALHAIGDRANAIALDVFERLRPRGRIEHVQLLRRGDLQRLDLPGLVLGVQPAHAPDDRDVADQYWAGRTDRACAYASMQAAGATLEFGSDAPVAPLDPWDGIASAVRRTDDERPPWHPEEALTTADALAASTGGRTRVHAGDVADLMVLDDHPAALPAVALPGMRVAATLLAGRWTHSTLA